MAKKVSKWLLQSMKVSFIALSLVPRHPFEREEGVYTMEFWVKPLTKSPMASFRRQAEWIERRTLDHFKPYDRVIQSRMHL